MSNAATADNTSHTGADLLAAARGTPLEEVRQVMEGTARRSAIGRLVGAQPVGVLRTTLFIMV